MSGPRVSPSYVKTCTYSTHGCVLNCVLNRIVSPLNYWIQRADRVAVNLRKLTHNSSEGYVDGIFRMYRTTRNNDSINEALAKLAGLQTSISNCEAEVLQLAGVGESLQHVTDIRRCVDEVVRWLEDLLCWALIGAEDLLTAHKQQSVVVSKSLDQLSLRQHDVFPTPHALDNGCLQP
jgi:hypothetical protein